jgi:hypothetical protein
MRRPCFPGPSAKGLVRGWLLALLLATTPCARAADVAFFGAIKEKGHSQTNGTALLLATNPFSFTALVVVSTNGGAVSSAYIQPAGRSATPLVQPTNSGNWFFSARFTNESALNTSYPNTAYKLGIQAVNDGFRELSLNLSSGAYPNAPRVANFNAAQGINASSDFLLQWNSFTTGTANDFIQLAITDAEGQVVFNSPTYGQATSLDGFAVSTTIPAGTLLPGRSYAGNLAFTKIFVSFDNQFIYPNVPGAAAFAARTVFRLNTLPLPASISPSLRIVSASAAAATLQFNSEAGVAYRLLTTTNLAFPAWTTVFATNAAGTNVTGVVTNLGEAGERFYRVVSP